MELLAAIFWLAILAADIAFMANIKRLADRLFPPGGRSKKSPGRSCSSDPGHP